MAAATRLILHRTKWHLCKVLLGDQKARANLPQPLTEGHGHVALGLLSLRLLVFGEALETDCD